VPQPTTLQRTTIIIVIIIKIIIIIIKVKKFSLCLSNEALDNKGAWGSGCIYSRILDLSDSWR
jgi:hypothetical protein